jgi:hypothetical protein
MVEDIDQRLNNIMLKVQDLSTLYNNAC